MAQIIIYVDGSTYEGKVLEQTKQEVADTLFEVVTESKTFRMTLDDGEELILGKNALANAHFLIK